MFVSCKRIKLECHLLFGLKSRASFSSCNKTIPRRRNVSGFLFFILVVIAMQSCSDELDASNAKEQPKLIFGTNMHSKKKNGPLK